MKRWWCVEMQFRGQRVFVGRVEATEAELRKEIGPYATINPINGECFIYGRPPA